MVKLENFNLLNQKVKHHIGLGGKEAHPHVDKFLSGFMTPEEFKQHNQIFDRRIYVGDDDNGIDIFSLEPGFYTSNRFKNGPTSKASDNYIDQWTAHLDVTRGWYNSRTYRYINSTTGDIWTCTVHFNQSFEDGSVQWLHEIQEVDLWHGSNDLKKPLTLTDKNIFYRNDSWLYRKFKIEYKDSIGQYNVADGKSNRQVLLNSSQVNNVNNTIFLETATIKFNKDNTVTLENDSAKKIITKTINEQDNVLTLTNIENNLTITNIWGVK